MVLERVVRTGRTVTLAAHGYSSFRASPGRPVILETWDIRPRPHGVRSLQSHIRANVNGVDTLAAKLSENESLSGGGGVS